MTRPRIRALATLLGLVIATTSARAHASDDPIRIHLDAPLGTVLEKRVRVGHWETVCAAPCGVDFPRSGHYRVNGPDIPRAQYVKMGDEREVTLRFSRPREERRAAGESESADMKPLLIAGTIAAGAGLLIVGTVLAAQTSRVASLEERGLTSGEEQLLAAGGLLTVAGMLMTVAYVAW